MAQKPAIPKGTRDFSPLEMARRNYIFNTIRAAFSLFGFRQIETPAMENLSTLIGKYGEEGDKLLFKILNSGDWLSPVLSRDLSEAEANKFTQYVSEKGLRYDLTVPFARYVVQHRNDLVFPFKRYQIQPVWRADRPQKGRYREFYQCDADIIGSTSLINEIELLQLLDTVFTKLRIRVSIKLNNRKILSGIAESLGVQDKIIDITTSIDKIDKIGFDGVVAELQSRGLSEDVISQLTPILQIHGTIGERLETLRQVLAKSETGLKGVEELQFIIDGANKLGLNNELDLDVSLARGLNYYTGAIIEVKALDVAIGSISGGGRYDNLTGVFGMPDVSGVGVSFGADRIYDVLNALNLYPDEIERSIKVLFLNLGAEESSFAMQMIKRLRQYNISAEIYPDSVKMKKQMSYANDLGVKFVAIVGSDEMANGTVAIRNMDNGQQTEVNAEEIVDFFEIN